MTQQHLVFDQDGETLGFVVREGRRGWLAVPRTTETAISKENRRTGEWRPRLYPNRDWAIRALKKFEASMARDPARGLVFGGHYVTSPDMSQTHVWDEHRRFIRTVHH